MEILGIGMPELIFIFIIALIVLGPKDMQKAGKTIGKFLRDVVTSDGWKLFQQTSRDLRTLPNKLMREANEELNQINQQVNTIASPRTSNLNPAPNPPPRSQPVTTIPTPRQDATTPNASKSETPERSETESDKSDNA